MPIVRVDPDLLRAGPMIVCGIDCRGRADLVHEAYGEQSLCSGTRREVDSIEVRKRIEHRIYLVAMDMAIFGDLLVGIGIHEFGGAAVVTEEWYIRHGCHHVRDEPGCCDGDASALGSAGYSDPGCVHVGVAARGLDRTNRVREDAAIVVMLGLKNPLGHAAGEMRVSAIRI